MQLDAVIFGGGAAGLWLLDDLHRAGYRALLLEAHELGRGQTVASQGIIHGGLKYMLHGMWTKAAGQIRNMPHVWRAALNGEAGTNLLNTRIRSQYCLLWQTHSVRSWLGMLAARCSLKVPPRRLSRQDRPSLLKDCPGMVARMDEQVIAPDTFVQDLADQHHERILKIDAERGLRFRRDIAGNVTHIDLSDPRTEQTAELRPARVIFTAGGGNAALRKMVGLPQEIQQKRPLHMVLFRGALPQFNGHCIDGARTRVTITSDVDSRSRTVWQVGGQIAEEGVHMDSHTLLAHARRELEAVLPGLDLSRIEGATYRVDRAERSMKHGQRPDSVQIELSANILTAWPTKLALAPKLAGEILRRLPKPQVFPASVDNTLADWPHPVVATTPWDAATDWQFATPEPVRRAA